MTENSKQGSLSGLHQAPGTLKLLPSISLIYAYASLVGGCMTCNRYNASSGLVEHRVCLINFNGAPIRICDDCRQYLFQQLDPAAESPPKSASDICANDFATNGIMESVERSTIEQALKDSGGNKFETAKRLGIGRQTLYNKIKAYRIKV